MEPAALGLPILIGPRFEDFTQPVRALRDAGGLRVVERDTLAAELARLLGDDGERRQMADAARACVDRYRGAADRHARMILDLLASPAEGPPRTDAQHTASSAS
jgi:3-deoxy-D-manno-octulosonic-acid transferase